MCDPISDRECFQLRLLTKLTAYNRFTVKPYQPIMCLKSRKYKYFHASNNSNNKHKRSPITHTSWRESNNDQKIPPKNPVMQNGFSCNDVIKSTAHFTISRGVLFPNIRSKLVGEIWVVYVSSPMFYRFYCRVVSIFVFLLWFDVLGSEPFYPNTT